ncbi:hypothetical protein CLU79DRAFT_682279, partial [Phycomyces nitens]
LKPLVVCRPKVFLEPPHRLSMSKSKHSQTLHWRREWLSGGIPRPCIYHSFEKVTHAHATICLYMHAR